MVQAVLARLKARGIVAHAISRGYGGRLAGPVRVDPRKHGSDDVGDEPLLLADAAPTWISRDRGAAARLAVKAGAQALVLDDGHQNLSVAADLSLVVVDGAMGFGNECIIPAGPLREDINGGLARGDLMIVMGARTNPAIEMYAAQASLGIVDARLLPVGAAGLSGLKALAFAGIGRPAKFFETLREAGLILVDTQEFPDHHPYHAGELSKLSMRAQALDAMLVTTQKDWIRLEVPWRSQVACVMVETQFEDASLLDAALDRLFQSDIIAR